MFLLRQMPNALKFINKYQFQADSQQIDKKRKRLQSRAKVLGHFRESTRKLRKVQISPGFGLDFYWYNGVLPTNFWIENMKGVVFSNIWEELSTICIHKQKQKYNIKKIIRIK